MDAIISHGSIPGTATLVDEPSLLVQSLTITPQRTEQRFKGPSRATVGLTYTDPVLDFQFNAIITGTGELATGGPGILLLDIANFAALTHGFDPEDGILVYRDPADSKDQDNPDSTTFTVTHFPFVPKSFATATIGTGNAALLVTAKVHGPTGNAKSIATAINNTSARTALTVAEASNVTTVTSGDKRRMVVTTNFGSGEETVSLIRSGTDEWTSDGLPFVTMTPQAGLLKTDLGGGEKWWILRNDTIGGSATIANTYPDEETWDVNSSQGGTTPVVTPAAATGSQALALINATGALPLTAALAPGSDGTAAIAAAGPVTLTGG